MLEGFSGAARIPELKRRLIFTAMALAVYRIGVAVPTPGIDGQALASFFDAASGTLFGQFNLFSGGAFERRIDREKLRPVVPVDDGRACERSGGLD